MVNSGLAQGVALRCATSPVNLLATLCSQALARGGLTREQECLRIRSLTADFERSEILVPLALRNQRMGFNPKPKLIKVSNADASIPHPVHQMLADCGREFLP